MSSATQPGPRGDEGEELPPLGPVVKKPKHTDENPADTWFDVPGKPEFEVNGLGKLRTKLKLPLETKS